MGMIVFYHKEHGKDPEVLGAEKHPYDPKSLCQGSPPCGGCPNCLELQARHYGNTIGFVDEEISIEGLQAMAKQCKLLCKGGSEEGGCSCDWADQCQLGVERKWA